LRHSKSASNNRANRIANIGPNSNAAEHTLNTLRYASRVRAFSAKQPAPKPAKRASPPPAAPPTPPAAPAAPPAAPPAAQTPPLAQARAKPPRAAAAHRAPAGHAADPSTEFAGRATKVW